MGFFEFLWLLIKLAIGIVVFIMAASIVLTQYSSWKQKREERLRFERARPQICEAIRLLDEARNRIPQIASANRRSYSSFPSIFGTSDLEKEMRRNFRDIVAGCRLKYGDYVTIQALCNLGLERYATPSVMDILDL